MNHVKENWSEAFLHVRADPNQEPVVELHSGGEHCADTRTGADGNAAAEEVGQIGKTSELCRGRLADGAE